MCYVLSRETSCALVCGMNLRIQPTRSSAKFFGEEVRMSIDLAELLLDDLCMRDPQGPRQMIGSWQ